MATTEAFGRPSTRERPAATILSSTQPELPELPALGSLKDQIRGHTWEHRAQALRGAPFVPPHLNTLDLSLSKHVPDLLGDHRSRSN